ncbi:phage minor tail protein L [Zooshikella sp. RANM57]|uniref:phage minor tail protein L n=1 Tax=Zooshikella sp. RANM57 TaxID=3425863 RepID=UPI003D6FED7A
MSLDSAVQTLAPGELITIYELDLTMLGGEVLRFASTIDVPDPVYFNGYRYLPVEIEAHGFDCNGRGALPTPTLRISNAERIASAAMQNYNDLLGGKLTRIRTFSQFLDNGADPDPDARFADDIYRIEQKTAHNKVYVEWEMSALLDQEGRKLPGRQVLRDACTHVYRTYNTTTGEFDYSRATCPYTGKACFDHAGNQCGSAQDFCSKKLSDCRKRFGQNAELPTRAFPGVAKIRSY